MKPPDTHSINTLLQESEKDIKQICHPYNGNCFEIALALSRIFHNHDIQFYSIYAEEQFINDPHCLPLHITISIDGELFDAGGHLHQTQLLEEFAPMNNEDLIHTDNTFDFDHVVSEPLVEEIYDTYSNQR